MTACHASAARTVARESERALLELSRALALMIGVLTFFLYKKKDKSSK